MKTIQFTRLGGLVALLCLQIAASAESIPRQWLTGHVPAAAGSLIPTGNLPPGQELKLAIGLPLRDREGLTNLLQKIYDPASPSYHRYLTASQFTARFGPTEEDYQALEAFALGHGLKVVMTHSNRVVLDVSGAVSNVEAALHVRLRTYLHPREPRLFYAPDAEPSLDLATPILHIGGLNNYTAPKPMSLRLSRQSASSSGFSSYTGSGPNGTFMGPDFRAAYVPGTSLDGAGQSVGLLEFDGYYPSDVAEYASSAGVPAIQLKPVLLDGFNGKPGGDEDEVVLDIDMIACMAPGVSSIVVYQGELPDSILNRMASDNVSKQLSSSWSYEVDAVAEQDLLEFAAQGQSFFNSSGDSDAYATTNYPPPPPTDDPNLTSVGGTSLTTTGPGGAWVSETVWNWDVEYPGSEDGEGSSGGISPTYPIPYWQTNVSMAINGGSSSFRNLPDVALTADEVYLVYNQGTVGVVGGTSCAAPLWAAFTALVNEQAVTNDLPTVGFLNPALYALGLSGQYGSCFHDITTGSNTWSQSTNQFQAVTGFDLCTGWGSPAGTNLINYLAPPDALQISPGGGFAASGGAGGPLTPYSQTYTLTNGGAAQVSWAAGGAAAWLDVSATSGTLNPGGPAATVVVSLDAAATNLAPGIYATALWFTNLTDGAAFSRPCILSIIQPPVITAEPTNQTTIGGPTVEVSAGVAGGLPLNCQWLFNGNILTNGARICGAQSELTEAGNIYGSTSSVLTISNVTGADAGVYSLVASNAAGIVVSSNMVLSVTPSRPVIVTQPASLTVLFGATVQLAATVDGSAPLTCQWYLNQTKLTDGGGFSGSQTPVLAITGASSTSAGAYVLEVSNLLGAATSTDAVLTVESPMSGDQLVQNGGFETGTFSSWGDTGNFTDCSVSSTPTAVHAGNFGALLGAAGSLGYLLQSLPTQPGQSYLISLWVDSPDGQTPNEFLVGWNGSPVFDQTGLGAFGWTNLQFFVTATSSNTVLELGFQDDSSFLGLDDIQVFPLTEAGGQPAIVTQPAGQTAGLGTTASLTVVASGQLPLSYQWQFDGANLVNETNATLTLTNLTYNQTGNYDVLVSNALGSVASTNAAIEVSPVQNGGFELGNFHDWTETGNSTACFVTTNSLYIHSGIYGAQLGPSGSPGFLAQSIPTVAGGNYLLSAWLRSDGQFTNLFAVSWNGTIIFDKTNIPATGWTNLHFNVSATSTNTVLEFEFRNDPGFFGLDDISLAPAPAIQFYGIQVEGANLILFGSNGAVGQTHYVLASTNLSLPLAQWVPVATNVLGAAGNFSITVTNAVFPNAAQQFFRLRSH